MTDIFVNQTLTTLDPPPQTWGDLLDRLDQDAGRDGVLIAAAHIDGVDVPAFRNPDMTVHRLSAVGRVDVETASPVAFVRRCLRDSVTALEQAADVAIGLSTVYRGHDVTAGHAGLTTLAVELGGLASIVATLNGLGIDLKAVSADGMTAPEHLDALGGVLTSLVAAQESEDWLTVADVLEYDLEPAIRHWITLLGMLVS